MHIARPQWITVGPQNTLDHAFYIVDGMRSLHIRFSVEL